MSNNNNNLPLVTACLPAWNAASFIQKTLECLANQTYDNLEVIISDDASSDQTVMICQEFIHNHPNFRIIKQGQNLGWIDNVNFLLGEAIKVQSKYLFFAFHDDLLDPNYVSSLVEKLEQNDDAVLAFSDMETIFTDGEKKFNIYQELEQVKDRLARGKIVIEQQGDWWTPHRGIFRADAAQKIGGLKKHLAGEFSADWPWLLHLSLLGEFERLPAMLCHKYYKPKSVSRNWLFNNKAWFGATLSCAREVQKTDLTLPEKLSLQLLLAEKCLAIVRKAIKGRVNYVMKQI